MTMTFQALRDTFRPSVGTGKHIAVIAPPKSGSTALANMLSELSGWPVLKYTDKLLDDYTFYPPQAMAIADKNAIIHLHSRPSPQLMAWMDAKRMIPIVMSRTIADCIVSMVDHSLKSDSANNLGLHELTHDTVVRVIFHKWISWYVTYLVDWRAAKPRFRNLLLTDYDHAFPDPTPLLRKALQVNGAPVPSAEEARQAYDRVMADRQKSNFNVGKSGRGRQLPPDLQAIIPLMLNPAVAEKRAAG